MVRNFVIHILLLAVYHRTTYCRTGHQEIREKIIISFVLIIWCLLAIGIYFHVLTHRIRIPGGAHGYFVCFWLNSFIGEIGSFFLLIVSFAAILFFGFENAFNKCVTMIKNYFARRAQLKEERALAREAALARNEKK